MKEGHVQGPLPGWSIYPSPNGTVYTGNEGALADRYPTRRGSRGIASTGMRGSSYTLRIARNGVPRLLP